MVLCYMPHPCNFDHDRALLLNFVKSGPARYGRIIKFHPEIRDRLPELLDLGYPPHFPETLFRCEFILKVICYHFFIIDFEQRFIDNIIALRNLMMSLKRVHTVSVHNFI
jgi:hypothetical protein